MGIVTRSIVLLFLFFVTAPSPGAFAKEDQESPLSFNDGSFVVEQIVAVAFQPRRVFVLLSSAEDRLLQYPGYFIVRTTEPDPNTGDVELLVMARIPPDIRPDTDESVSFSFFLLGNDGTFAATPVKTLNGQKIKESSVDELVLQQQMDAMAKKLTVARTEFQRIDRDLNTLRDRASGIVNVDEIIELKMRLAKLQSSGQDNSAERERLRVLVDLGRQMDDPPEVYTLLQELSLHLSETAKATAMADRLNSRRRDVARANLNDRLAIIREMRNVDAEAAGKEILSLRSKRKKLEEQLSARGVTSSDEEVEF